MRFWLSSFSGLAALPGPATLSGRHTPVKYAIVTFINEVFAGCCASGLLDAGGTWGR
jgi:hypothetical protein